MENKNLKLIGVFMVILSIVAVLGFNFNNINSNPQSNALDKASDLSNNVVVSKNSNEVNNNTGSNIKNLIQNKTGSDLNNGSFNVNTTNNDIIFYYNNSNTNKTIKINLSKEILNKYLKLNNNEELIKFWFNNNFDINGFNSNSIYAFLIYNKIYKTYKFIYYINNNEFIIDNLIKVNKNIKIEKRKYKDVELGKYIKNINYVLVNKDYNNVGIFNYIAILNNNDFKIILSFCHAYDYINNHGDTSISDITNNFYHYNLRSCKGWRYSNVPLLFSMNNINGISMSSISKPINDLTETQNFNNVEIIKNSLDKLQNKVSYKNFKIFSSEDFKNMIDYNSNYLDSFLIDLIKNNINYKNINNIINVNNASYKIGDDINGLINTNYFIQKDNLKNGSVLVIDNINYVDMNNNYNLRIKDDGELDLKVQQIKLNEFGNIYGNNIDLTTGDKTYIVNATLWHRAVSLIWSLLNFDFNSVKQYWNKYQTNAILSNDKTENLNNVYYGFNNNMNYKSWNDIYLNFDKSNSNIIYKNKKYYYYLILNNNKGNNGCLLIGYHNNLLDINIPAVICGNHIAVLSGLSQFKISNGDTGKITSIT